MSEQILAVSERVEVDEVDEVLLVQVGGGRARSVTDGRGNAYTANGPFFMSILRTALEVGDHILIRHEGEIAVMLLIAHAVPFERVL